MPRKLFLQIVALIVFGGFIYWADAQILSWQADRAYRAHQAEIVAATEKKIKNIIDATSADDAIRRITTATAPANDNANEIDGQQVTRKGDHWENSLGANMGRADQ